MEIKHGDFVTYTNKDIVHIGEVYNAHGELSIKWDDGLISELNDFIGDSNFRKATPRETANEKLRRKWANWDRMPNEWKEGDIVVDDLDHSSIGAITKIEGDVVYTTFEKGGLCCLDITMVTPVDMRYDLK